MRVLPFPLLCLALALAACTPDGDTCTDEDGDGTCAGRDCDDEDASRHREAEEICNQRDDDCDGEVGAEELSDLDLDGTVTCLDCNDADATIGGGAFEFCDGIDQDCDGLLIAGEEDLDFDGQLACVDCDDSNGARYHGAVEICDGLDDDCDGVLPPQEEDPDSDTFLECGGDCNPHNETVAPGLPEQCDGFDTDCDGTVGPATGDDRDNDGLLDEAEDVDSDEDGHLACADCDDEAAEIGPGAAEVCDGVDNNCDGGFYFDEVAGNGKTTDDDGDLWSPCLGDCDDLEPLSHPDTWEFLTDGLDNDCDGVGDNAPGWGPMDREDTTLEQEMAAACDWNAAAVAILDFEGQPAGSFYAPTLGVSFAASAAGTPVAVRYQAAGSDGTAPRGGTALVESDAPIDSFTLTFDAPQTSVVVGLSGLPADSSAVSASFAWDGTTLGGSASVLGASPMESPWDFRGTAVVGNVAWDAVTVTLPAAARVRWDDLWFCRGPALP